MASNYPPGFGSARDLDHVEGPLSEVEIEGPCPECDEESLMRLTWRSGGRTIVCGLCDYEREEEVDEYDDGPDPDDERDRRREREEERW